MYKKRKEMKLEPAACDRLYVLGDVGERIRNRDLHGGPQLVGVIHGAEHEQTQHHTPEVPAQLRGQIICQVLHGGTPGGERWLRNVGCLTLCSPLPPSGRHRY